MNSSYAYNPFTDNLDRITPPGFIPPTVASTYTTDINTPAIPAANILIVTGGSSTVNNNNGVRTDGSGGSNTLTVQLTNRLSGTGSTVGAVNTDLITFALGATPGVYIFEFEICGFESSTPAGVGYSVFGTVRTTGAAAVLVGTPDKIVNEEVALLGCDVNLVVSGNSAIVRATGVAPLTISWRSLGQYTLVT